MGWKCELHQLAHSFCSLSPICLVSFGNCVKGKIQNDIHLELCLCQPADTWHKKGTHEIHACICTYNKRLGTCVLIALLATACNMDFCATYQAQTQSAALAASLHPFSVRIHPMLPLGLEALKMTPIGATLLVLHPSRQLY